MKLLTPYFTILTSLLLHSPFFAQDTIRVPQDQPTIQLAMNAASSNNVVLVAPGIYVENLDWPDFTMGLKLIGELGPDSTIIDGNQNGKSVIYRGVSVNDFTSIIQGFTIRNGRANQHGGGINIWGRGTALKDLIITNNRSDLIGGGVHLTNYAGIIDHCIFRNNNNYSNSTASNGGGMYISMSGDVEIRNSIFQNNTCGSQNSNSANGAGLYATMGIDQTLLIENCEFIGNSNNHNTWTQGGGLYVEGGTVTMDSCIVISNTCSTATHSYGGGIYSKSLNFTLKNSEVAFNKADTALALMLQVPSNMNPTINTLLNAQVYNNQIPNQTNRPVIELRAPSSSLEIRNSLIDDNRGLAIHVTNTAIQKSSLVLRHSLFNF